LTDIESFDDSHTIVLGGRDANVATRVLKPGDLVGGSYELTELLGRGGMGLVFCARHNMIQQRYALKMLDPEQSDEISRRRFEIEGRAIALLDHPNIVKVYNMGLDAGEYPFYVMDLLDGIALSDYIMQKQRLSFQESLDVFSQIASGLGYAHSKGIVHRDVKPSNIVLLAQSNGGQLVKIVDFGIAKVTSSAGFHSQAQTASGEVLGSPLYMSPEQSIGAPVDHRSDIYSLGCTLYEALCGQPPYRGPNAMATLMMHQNEAVPSILRALPEQQLPQSVDLLLAKMMAKRPENRYQSMEQFMHDLERIKQGKAIGTVAIANAGPALPPGVKETRLHDAQGLRVVPDTVAGYGDRDDSLAKSSKNSGSRSTGIAYIVLALIMVGGAFAGMPLLRSAFRLGPQPTPALTAQSAPQPTSRVAARPTGQTAGQQTSESTPQPGGLNLPLPDAVAPPPDPETALACAAFGKIEKIKPTIVVDGGRQLRKFVFPEWTVGKVSIAGGPLNEARREVLLPAVGRLKLEIGANKSHHVFSCPGIIGKIDRDQFSVLSITGQSNSFDASMLEEDNPKTTALVEMLESASKWSKLDILELVHLTVTKDAFRQVNKCTQLSDFSIKHCTADIEDLAAQSFLRRLHQLAIEHTTNIGPVFRTLADSPNILDIRLIDCQTSADDLMQLRRCPQLHTLVLTESNLSAVIPAIIQIKALRNIQLFGPHLSPQDMEAIIACPALEHLFLRSVDGYGDEEQARYLKGNKSRHAKISFEG
jgi:serine/threonine protein kinase